MNFCNCTLGITNPEACEGCPNNKDAVLACTYMSYPSNKRIEAIKEANRIMEGYTREDLENFVLDRLVDDILESWNKMGIQTIKVDNHG
jgi:hypothetical protein